MRSPRAAGEPPRRRGGDDLLLALRLHRLARDLRRPSISCDEERRRDRLGALRRDPGQRDLHRRLLPTADRLYEGLGLAIAAAGLCAAASAGRFGSFPTSKSSTKSRRIRRAPGRARRPERRVAEDVREVTRPRVLVPLAGRALGSFAARSIVPIRSLGPAPDEPLFHTRWRKGRAPRPRRRQPVHVGDLNVDSTLTVFPEGALGDAQSLGHADSRPRKHRGDSERIHRLFARLHARRMPRRALSRATKELMCPCHQSVFDVMANGAVVSGPADHALPRLPIEVGDGRRLRATGDFPRPGRPRLLGTRMIERFLALVDDRLGTAHFRAPRVAQGVSRSLVVHARRDQSVRVRHARLRPARFSRSSSIRTRPKTVYDGPYTLLDGVGSFVRLRSVMALSFEVNLGLAGPADPSLDRVALRCRHRRPHGTHLLHWRFRKPREINWLDRLPALLAGDLRGFSGIFAARRSVQRHRAAHRRFGRCNRFRLSDLAQFLLVGGVFRRSSLSAALFVAARLSRSVRDRRL